MSEKLDLIKLLTGITEEQKQAFGRLLAEKLQKEAKKQQKTTYVPGVKAREIKPCKFKYYEVKAKMIYNCELCHAVTIVEGTADVLSKNQATERTCMFKVVTCEHCQGRLETMPAEEAVSKLLSYIRTLNVKSNGV